MEIGTEISQKIRSAIKAKLVELGAYVDDELPDYIMVMVANKKSKKQMSDDLSLFLAHNTDKFTSWLHSLLNKLQTLSTDQQKSNEIDNDSKKSSDPKKRLSPSQKPKIESKVPCREKSAGVKRKSSDKGSSQKSEVKKRTVDSGSTKSGKSNLPATKPISKSVKDTKKSTEEEPELIVKADTDEFSEEFKEKEEIGQSKFPDRDSRKATSHPTSRVKATSSSSVKVSVSVKTSSSTTSSVKRSSKTVNAGERTVQRVPARKTTPDRRKKPSSVVASSHIVKRYAEEAEEEYDPYNPAVGRVASVVKVDRRSTVPPSLQANKLLVMKAVNEAEKSCAKKTQSVLRQEKMYSEKERALIRPIQRLEKPDYSSFHGKVQKEEGGLELISKSRRQELLRSMTYTIDNFTAKPLPGRLGEKRKHEPEVARVQPVMDSRFVQCTNDDDDDDEHLAQDLEEVVEHETDEDVQSVQEEVDEINSRSTEDREEVQSEVTDDVQQGQEEEEGEEEEEEVVEEGEPEEEQQNQTDPEIQQVLEDVDDDLDLGEEQETVHPKVDKTESVKSKQSENRRLIKERPKPKETKTEKSVNTKFIVTLDGVEPEIYEEKEIDTIQVEDNQQQFEEQEEYVEEYEEVVVAPAPPKVTPPKIKPISINLKDTDDETEEEEEEAEEQEDSDVTPLKKAKMMERCKFWPACINGNSCPYHHPTTTCKTFPHCKFGDKCLYIHPNCKFDSKCTRTDCPFTHASRRGNLTTVIQQIVPVPVQPQTLAPMQTWAASSAVPTAAFPKQGTQVTCKFFPNCRNMSCPFNHPKPCRYGLACGNKQACTFYHPSVPTKDKLTWTAQKTAKHISDRKFDAGKAKSLPTSVT